MRSTSIKRTLALLALVVMFGTPILACSITLPIISGQDDGSKETELAAHINASVTAYIETEASMATITPPPSPTLPLLPVPTDTPMPSSVPTEASTPTFSGPWVGKIVFATNVTQNNEPIDPGTVFKKGITTIYAVFPYSGFEEGKKVTLYWTVNGKEFVSVVRTWQWDPSGTYAPSTAYSNNRQLDAGNWQLNIFVDNKLLGSGSFKITP
jgi:hypothetical protein